MVVTRLPSGRPHNSPLGPIVSADGSQLILRPFQTSQTFQNLVRWREGVFHVTDNAEALALAAIGLPVPHLTWRKPKHVATPIWADANRWMEFRIRHIDARSLRSEMIAEVVARGEGRPFWGWNRAKHAVVEAAILSTRLHLMTPEDCQAQLDRLRPLVEKTAGPAERRAMAAIESYIRRWRPEAT